MTKNLVRVHIFISGLVQGVFYRQKTQDIAKELGIGGWVRNLANGQVEIIAEGDKERIEELITWLKKGPAGAKVEKVDFNFENYKSEFSDFEIK